MKRIRTAIAVSACLLVLAVAAGWAQWRRGRDWRQPPPDRSDYPSWEIDAQFAQDVFTFVRIRYRTEFASVMDGRWDNDYPDADWNLSYRLQELTSLQVDPQGKVLELTDPELCDYPFIFMLGVRDLVFSEAEVTALRRYLARGGFLMVDDFWTEAEWQHLRQQMKRVLPDVHPRELSLDHEIFHIVYELPELPQVPSIQAWRRGWDFEYWHGDPRGDTGPHFWGYADHRGRLMALCCLNNDICDGWEREGENATYFHQYSERWSYPLGINIIVYAMTH